MVKEYFLAGLQPHISTQYLSILSFQILCSVSKNSLFIKVKIKLVWELQTSGKLPDLELLNPNTGSPILLTLEFPAVKSLHNCLTKIVMRLVFKKTIKTTEKSMRISGLYIIYFVNKLPTTKEKTFVFKKINCSDSTIFWGIPFS